MNNSPKRKHPFFFLIVLMVFLVSGCGSGQLLGPTITPSATSTRTPTITPSPTATSIPSPTPTPLPELGLGIPNSGSKWQITLNRVRTADSLTMQFGGKSTFTPNEGFAFLILDVTIKNLDPTQAMEISQDNIAILDANNTIHTASGGGWGETSMCGCAIVFSQAVGAENISAVALAKDYFFFGFIPSGQPISFVFVVSSEDLTNEWQLQFQNVPTLSFKLGDEASYPLRTETTPVVASLPQECQAETIPLAQSQNGIVYQEWLDDKLTTKLAFTEGHPPVDLCKGFAYASLQIAQDGGILLAAGSLRGWTNFYIIEPGGQITSLVRNALVVSGDFLSGTDYVVISVMRLEKEGKELYLYDRKKSSMTLLYGGRNVDYRTFPGGVLLVKVTPADSVNEIEYMGPVGTGALPELKLPEENHSADITPDGKHLLFTSYAGGANRIYISNLDGSDKQELAGHYITYRDKVLSPDGKYMLIPAKGTNSTVEQAFLHDVQTGSSQSISPDSNEVAYSFSPDGKWAVAISTFKREETDKAKTLKQTLHLFNLEDKKTVKEIQGEIVNYFFSPDNAFLAYTLKDEDETLSISAINLSDLSEQQIGAGLLIGWSAGK